jgi:hypothetical protein
MVHDLDTDREVLDRQAGRVEDRDLVRPRTSCCIAREDRAQFRHTLAPECARLDRMDEVAVVACLLEVEPDPWFDFRLRSPPTFLATYRAEIVAPSSCSAPSRSAVPHHSTARSCEKRTR